MTVSQSQLDREILGSIKRSPRSLRQVVAKLVKKFGKKNGLAAEDVVRRCEALEKKGRLVLEEPTGLAAEILKMSREGPKTVSQLSAQANASEEQVGAACRSLRYYGFLSAVTLGEFDARIFDALKGDEPVQTAELVQRVKPRRRTGAAEKPTARTRSRVYSRCKRLEGAFLKSKPVKSKRFLYFFPVTGDILTATTYPQIDEVMRDLQAIVRRHPIKRGAELSDSLKEKLCGEYRTYLQRLASRAKPKEAKQIESFEGQLMAVLQGTKKSDVVGLLGLRRFRPTVRAWEMRAPNNPGWREHIKLRVSYWFKKGEQVPPKGFPGGLIPAVRVYVPRVGPHAGKRHRRRKTVGPVSGAPPHGRKHEAPQRGLQKSGSRRRPQVSGQRSLGIGGGRNPERSHP